MENLIAEQTYTFLLASALGVALGHVYDLLHCLRSASRRKGARRGSGGFARAVSDLLFCLTALVSLLVFMLLSGEGEMRIYIPGGAALGLALYFMSLSRLTRAWMTPALRFVYFVIARGKRALFALFAQPRGS